MKKLLTYVLALTLCLALTVPAWAEDTPTSGKCGENATWSLDSDGVLHISGTGDMERYRDISDTPWAKLKKNTNNHR